MKFVAIVVCIVFGAAFAHAGNREVDEIARATTLYDAVESLKSLVAVMAGAGTLIGAAAAIAAQWALNKYRLASVEGTVRHLDGKIDGDLKSIAAKLDRIQGDLATVSQETRVLKAQFDSHVARGGCS